MLRTYVLPVFLSLAIGMIGASVGLAQRAAAEHVILVSVDGLRPEFYLNDAWPAPVMQRLATQGASVDRIKGVFPTLTYPSHTTIVTGALPLHHGVFYNAPFEPDGPTGLRYWSYDSVRTETIWHAAQIAGLVTASIHWPVTLDAPIDFNIPEAWPLDPSVSRREFLSQVSSPPGLFDEMEREATGRYVDYDAGGPTERWRFRFLDARATDMAAYLLSVHRPNLMTVHLLSVDDAAHNGSNTPAVREALASVDASIGYLLETIDALGIADKTVLIVLGDHGFIETSTLLAPNVWLVEAGLRGPESNRGDWKASFHATGGSAFLHLRERGSGGTVHQVVDMLEQLPPELRSAFDIVPKEALLGLAADTNAALALAAKPGAAFTGTASPPAVRFSPGATHGFLADASPGIYTGLVAQGPGIRHGASVSEIGLEDIAPLVARLLGIDFEAIDGVPPEALIDGGPTRQ